MTVQPRQSQTGFMFKLAQHSTSWYTLLPNIVNFVAKCKKKIFILFFPFLIKGNQVILIYCYLPLETLLLCSSPSWSSSSFCVSIYSLFLYILQNISLKSLQLLVSKVCCSWMSPVIFTLSWVQRLLQQFLHLAWYSSDNQDEKLRIIFKGSEILSICGRN